MKMNMESEAENGEREELVNRERGGRRVDGVIYVQNMSWVLLINTRDCLDDRDAEYAGALRLILYKYSMYALCR